MCESNVRTEGFAHWRTLGAYEVHSMAISKPAGGAATAAGMDYQHRVTAWVAVQILAEKAVSPPPAWDLPAATTLEWLGCETGEPIDDLLVGTSAKGHIFAQVKHSLTLAQSVESALASALNQCVRQFVTYRAVAPGQRPWERSLDPTRDRLVLIIGPDSSKAIRVHLPTMLMRLRNFVQGQPLDDAARNSEEHRVLAVVVDHIKRVWQAVLGEPPADNDFYQLLSLLRVQELAVDAGGLGEAEARNWLRTAVLRNPEQADAAWAQLITICARWAAERSGTDRGRLQQSLLNIGIDIQAARSYRDDIECLKRHSQRTVKRIADFAHIRVGSTSIKIQRQSRDALRSAAEEDSLLVVGTPGAGKSGALHDLVQSLSEEGRDFICLAAGDLDARSTGGLRLELDLQHDLTEVLENWPGPNPAFLVIDALDAAREPQVIETIRYIIRAVVAQKGRWRVVASIRQFDLRYSQELKRLFAGEPPTAFQDPEFVRIRHLQIPPLSAQELAQVQHQSAALWQLIDNAPEKLRDLLHVPFNLWLMAQLIEAGIALDNLTPIRTQLELLDQYWSHRVIREHRQGNAREVVLRQVCEGMVQYRTPRVNRSYVADRADSSALHDLLSAQILIPQLSPPDSTPNPDVLTFAHHLLFDYAIARLLLRGLPETLISRLTDDPELAIVIRPSLVLHFQHLWARDSRHEQFWELVLQVIRTNGIPEIGKLIGPVVGAELAASLSDLELLCTALESADQERRKAGEGALRHLVRALLTTPRPLIGVDAGPWCDLLERVSRHLRAGVAYAVRTLLSTLCDHPEMFTSGQQAKAGTTARRLLAFAWSYTPRDRGLVIHALKAVCRTFASNRIDSAALLRRSCEHITQYGFEEMPQLAMEVKRLIPLDPVFVAELYKVVFAHREPSQESTLIGQSNILPLRSNRAQDYNMAPYGLAEAFPEFLTHAPKQATSALIAAIEAYVAHDHTPASREIIEESFDFNDIVLRFAHF